jgi:hypothetical protein
MQPGATIFNTGKLNYQAMTDKRYIEEKNILDFILSAVTIIAGFPFMLLAAMVVITEKIFGTMRGKVL